MADRDSLPKFLVDVQGWRSSRSVQRMSMAERGVYWEMLLEQWEKRYLPDDVEAVARAIASTPDQEAEVRAAWDVVRRKFVSAERGQRRIYNAKLEKTRREQRASIAKSREAGRIGGKASAAKRQQQKGLPSNDRSTVHQRSSTDQRGEGGGGSEGTGVDRKGEEQGAPSVAVTPPTARSKRPIFSGQRFVVFEWQLDDLMRLLGPLTEQFDLHEWFFELDTRMLGSSEAIPQRDGGKWLQEQTLSECRRRGLAVQADTPIGNKRVAGLVAGGEAFLRRAQS